MSDKPLIEDIPGGSSPGRNSYLIYFLLALVLLLLALCLVVTLGPGRRLLTPPPTSVPTSTAAATARSTAPPTDTPTETEAATPELTETSTPESGDGACNAACDPANSNCLAGLACLPVADTSGHYVCWNDAICLPTKPPTKTACGCQGADYVCPGVSVSYNSTQCGGSGQCGCRGTTWACPDGTYATFNPKCGVGGCGCVCIQYIGYYCYQYKDTCTGKTNYYSCP